jgi:hypothetical protein
MTSTNQSLPPFAKLGAPALVMLTLIRPLLALDGRDRSRVGDDRE